MPVVKEITEEAKMNSFKNTAYGLIKAGDLYYQRKDMLEEEVSEDVFNFPNGADKLKISGSLPEEGSMTINTDGDIALAITNGKYCITKGYEDRDVTITKDVENCKLGNEANTLSSLAKKHTFKKQVVSTSLESDGTVATATTFEDEVIEIPTCIKNKTKCVAGTPVAIKVNETETYKFYVINDNTIKNEVTLIMDRNLGEKVAWYNDNDDYSNAIGPITALNYLNKQTENWDNIPIVEEYIYNNNLNGTTNTYGYQKLEIVDGKGKLTSKDGVTVTEITGESRARLLTYEEYEVIRTNNSNTTPNWLYGNLYSTGDDSTFGYWLLTAYPSDFHYGRIVNFIGIWYYNSVSADSTEGCRPVITLSK